MLEPILITGANSAAGRALLRIAGTLGVRPIACVRSERAARQLPEQVALERVEQVSFDDEAGCVRAFEGARSVVHLPGILVERPGSSYLQANVAPVEVALRAAHRVGAKKFVLVSAIGADASSNNGYYASKGLAEVCVRRSGLEHTILRAPLLLGEGTEGEAALLRQLRSRTPRLLARGRTLQQPLSVEDLARAVLRCCDAGVAAGLTLDLVGPECLPYRELVRRAAYHQGRELNPRGLPVPIACLRLILKLRSKLWGPGFSVDALDVILDSHHLDPEPAARELGLEWTPLDAVLAKMVQRSHGG